MKYWKKKLKKKFKIYIDTIKLTNQYGNGCNCYIAYKTTRNGRSYYKLYMPVSVKPLKESDQWEVRSLKDFKKQ